MMLRIGFVLALATGLAAQVAPLSAQGNLALVIEPYIGSEERIRERVTEDYGRTARIIGFEDGKVIAEPF